MTLVERNEILKNGIDYCSRPKSKEYCENCPIRQMKQSIPICRDMHYLICSADKEVLTEDKK